MPRFWKSQHQASASIVFSGKNAESNDPRHWLTTDDIDGDAVFKLPAGDRVEFFRISLKGIATTKTTTAPPGSIQPRWKTEHSIFLSLAQEVPTRHDSGPGSAAVLKAPFRFNLHEFQQKRRPYLELPPSIISTEGAQKWSGLRGNDIDSTFAVTYSITAAAFSGDSILAKTSERLDITPATEAQPPIATTDFPGEYSLTARTAPPARFALKKNAPPKIEVRGEEPEPITLRATSGNFEGSTNVNLVVNISRGDSPPLDVSSLPTQCQLKAHLTAKTLVTLNGTVKGIPTLEYARHASDASIRFEKSHGQEYTVGVSDWIRCSADGDNTQAHDDDFFITKLPFQFLLAGDKRVAPTFNTPTLSRRYAIDLTLTFPNGSGQGLKLSIPVQIVYESGSADRVGMSKVD